MADVQTVEMKIPNMSDYVGVVRLAASGVANRLKFTHEEIEDIKIAVSEACTNAVQYAYPGKLGYVDIVFELYDSKLVIVVKDEGRGFNIGDKPTTQSDDPEKVGLGLGITFMRSLMDNVEYDTSPGLGTVVRMTKKVFCADAD